MTALLPTLLSLALFAAPDVRWVPVEGPTDVDVHSYRCHGLTLTAMGKDGSFHRLEDGGWVRLTGPPAGGTTHTSRMFIAPDETIWTTTGDRAILHRFDGEAWEGPITLPPGYVHDMVFAADGTPYAVGIHGYVVREEPEGWQTVPDLPIDKSVESNIYNAEFDRDGTLWLQNHEGLLLRVDAEGAVRLDPGDAGRYRVMLGADDRPLLTGNQLRRLDEEGWPVLVDRPVEDAAQLGDDWYLKFDERIWWSDLEEFVEVPFPSIHPPRGMYATRGGRLYAIDWGQNLFELQLGSAPVLRDVAGDWGVASLTDAGVAHVGDFDGDGLDDLVVLSDDGDLRLLLQRRGSFLDVTGEWDLSLRPRYGKFAACDFDGNGLPDLVTREVLQRGDGEDAEEGEAEVVQLRYLRTFDGRFEDATATLTAPGPPAVTEGSGLFTCDDVDGDGDIDLFVASGGTTLPPGPRVALYENLGYGHLRLAPLSTRGLGFGSGWVVKVLVEDMDQDGLEDFIATNSWGRGHEFLRGTPGRGVEDVTRGSGLDAIYGTTMDSWTARLDEDPYPDLVILDRTAGPRIWRGSADLRLDDVSQEWGLGGDPSWRSDSCYAGALTDLNSDGQLDLVAGCLNSKAGLMLGTADGPFVDHSEALPVGAMAVQRIVDLDLGGDGDRDLLLLYAGDEELFENLGSYPAAASAATAGYRSTDLMRGLSWARLFPDGVLAGLLVLIWVGAFAFTRSRGGDLALGKPLTAGMVLLTAAAAFALLLEAAIWTRLLLVLGSGGVATVWSVLEIVEVKRRSAINVGGFVLGDVIGKGGFGTVHRARHARGGTVAAVKMIAREHLADDQDRARFHAEAAACAAIRDDRVVRVFGKGEYTPYGEEGHAPIAYLVMELLDGLTLRQVLEQRGRLEIPEACAIGVEIGLALKAVDAAGIVHRDIKPDNVMLVRPNKVKVMDFGIARRAGAKEELEVVGTPGYMAPEQLLGQDEPTHLTDLYAVGTVLYELITGVRPFTGTRGDVIDGILYGDPAPFAEHGVSAPPEVEALVFQTLSKLPANRPGSGLEIANRLDPWAGDVPAVTVGPAAIAEANPRPPGVVTGGPTLGRAGVLWRLLRSWASWARSTGHSSYHEFLLSLVFDEARDPSGGEDLSTRLIDGLAGYRGDRTVAMVTRAHADNRVPAATEAPAQLKGPPPLPTELKAFGLDASRDGEEEP